MDIYSYLIKDHRAVAELMDKVLASQDASERQALFDTIKTELTLHADSEEQTFYQAILNADEDADTEDDEDDEEEELEDTDDSSLDSEFDISPLSAAEPSGDAEEEIEHAYDEHDEIREHLELLTELSVDSEEWMTQFAKFKAVVVHHVEEEETEVFVEAKKLISDEEAEVLAEEMDRVKAEMSRGSVYLTA